MSGTVLIGCPTCGRRYRYDTGRFGSRGVRIRCRTCEAVMRVDIPPGLQAGDGEAGVMQQVVPPVDSVPASPLPPMDSASVPAAAEERQEKEDPQPAPVLEPAPSPPRTVQDTALMLSAIAGPDPRSPIALSEPGAIFRQPLDRDFNGTRIAWSRNLNSLPMDPRVTAVIEGQRHIFGGSDVRYQFLEATGVQIGAIKRPRTIVHPVQFASLHVERDAVGGGQHGGDELDVTPVRIGSFQALR